MSSISVSTLTIAFVLTLFSNGADHLMDSDLLRGDSVDIDPFSAAGIPVLYCAVPRVSSLHATTQRSMVIFGVSSVRRPQCFYDLDVPATTFPRTS